MSAFRKRRHNEGHGNRNNEREQGSKAKRIEELRKVESALTFVVLLTNEKATAKAKAIYEERNTQLTQFLVNYLGVGSRRMAVDKLAAAAEQQQ